MLGVLQQLEIGGCRRIKRRVVASREDLERKLRALGAERAETIVTAPGRQGRAPQRLVSALSEATRLPVRVLSSDEEGRLSYEQARLVARCADDTTVAAWIERAQGSMVRLTNRLTARPPSA